MRIRLHWPNDGPVQFRNTIVNDPRPHEIVCDDWSYQQVGDSAIALSIFCDGNSNSAKYILFEFPTMIEYLGEV